mgnify:CR=1 FL=1
MRIAIITGGRHFEGHRKVREALDDFDPAWVVQGGAPGADSIAAAWCRTNGVQLVTFEAMWNHFGAKAGPRRNRMMADLALILARAPLNEVRVFAFPGGRGTADMIKACEARELTVIRHSD